MAKYVINVGNVANDGQGDPLRTAMQKINWNFTEVYDNVGLDVDNKNITVGNTIFIGNTSVNATINATIYTGSANNASYINGTSPSYYIQNTDSRVLSGNLIFTASNVYFNQGLSVNTFAVVNSTGIATSANLQVSGYAHISGNARIDGSLYVAGDTTYVNSTVITTSDKNIILASNATSQLEAYGAGMVIGNYANLVYNDTLNSFDTSVSITPYFSDLGLGRTGMPWLYVIAKSYYADEFVISDSFYSNSSLSRYSNSTSNTVISPGSIVLRSSDDSHTINLGNTFVNSTSISTTAVSITDTGLYTDGVVECGGAIADAVTVNSNTLLLGTNSASSNGYTYLPNNMKMNWGWVSANSSDGNAVFTDAFTTSCFVVTATSSNTDYNVAVTTSNTTAVEIRTSNASSTNVYYMAIGI